MNTSNTSTNVVPYIFPVTNQSVRTVVKDDEPWFCLKDVCECLGIGNPSDVVKRLNKADLDSIKVSYDSGVKSLTFIDESNLYRVIFRSDKENAVKFQNWVFEKVLPAIRKDGSYGKSPVPELPKPLDINGLIAALPTLIHLGTIKPDDVRFNQVLRDSIYNGMIGHQNGNDRRWMTCLEIAQMMGLVASCQWPP